MLKLGKSVLARILLRQTKTLFSLTFFRKTKNIFSLALGIFCLGIYSETTIIIATKTYCFTILPVNVCNYNIKILVETSFPEQQLICLL